jgi:hypothetical protein
LSTGKLYITKSDGEEQLNPEFLSEDIFILTKPNNNQNIQLFINEKNISDQNIEQYIENTILIYQNEGKISSKSTTNYQKKLPQLQTFSIKEKDIFDIKNYPSLIEEVNKLKKDLEQFPTIYYKQIITSYAKNHSLETNPALCYAGIRNILYANKFKIEALCTWSPKARGIAEWWKQGGQADKV